MEVVEIGVRFQGEAFRVGADPGLPALDRGPRLLRRFGTGMATWTSAQVERYVAQPTE